MNRQNKIRKSLKFSLLDGVFASCMMGLTTDYITPYALALKAQASDIGNLNCLSNLFSSLVQLKTADVTDRLASRKKVVTFFVLLQALMGIPIILAPYLFRSQALPWLIVFVAFFNAFNAFALPAWSSWIAEHIPAKSRGRYFGWRNKILGAVTIASSFAAGGILYAFTRDILKGFLVVFSLAFVARICSWYFLTRMYEPPFKVKKEAYFSFPDFLKRLRHSNFARFVLFVATLNFCVNVASPFFSVFMLKDLKFNYLTYTIVVVTVPIVQILTIDRWGRHADRFGNLRVIRFGALFIASLPLWWIINQHPVYLIIIQVISGFAWSGFLLCSTNFIYDAVTPEKRTRCIAYFNALAGAGTSLGALAGGRLLGVLPPLFGYRILSLFLVASILRFAAVFFFSTRIREVRHTEHVTTLDLVCSVAGIRPLMGFGAGVQGRRG